MIQALASLIMMAADGGAAPPATMALYQAHCQSCHMADGDSPLEPLNFADGVWKHGSTPAKVAEVIAKGVPGTAMLSFESKLKPAEVRALAAHVRAFDRKLKAPAKAVKKTK